MKGNVVEFTRASDTADADFSLVRGEEVLRKLLRRYPDDAERLQRAHDRLKDDSNYAAAMHRVAQSLHEGKIQVFISYRSNIDADAASAVAEVFRELSVGKVVVTFADEFTAHISGQDYKSEIEAAIKASHWFVILVSEAREPSDWCMYETGMFRACATSRKMERLICIHHPNAMLPSAIDQFQAVATEGKKLQSFLDGIFRRIDPLPGWDALNPTLDRSAIVAAAALIEKAVRPPRNPESFNCRLTLEVRTPGRLKNWADLASCKIETDYLTANLFGKLKPPRTWGDLIANVRKKNSSSKWLEELVAVIKKASGGNVVRPVTSTFECAHGGRVMRPVVDAMEHDGVSDEYRFHLFFLEEISSAPVHRIPPGTLALLTAVRMNNRVRWEVLQRYSNIEWTRRDIEACSKAFSRIEREGQAFGHWDVEELRANYHESDQDEIVDITKTWRELRDPITGKLSVALKQLDVTGINEGLSAIRALNTRFFELTFPVLEQISTQQTYSATSH